MALAVCAVRIQTIGFDHVLAQETAAVRQALRPVLGADAVFSTDGVAKELGVAIPLSSPTMAKVGTVSGTFRASTVTDYSCLKSWMAFSRNIATKYLPELSGLAPPA